MKLISNIITDISNTTDTVLKAKKIQKIKRVCLAVGIPLLIIGIAGLVTGVIIVTTNMMSASAFNKKLKIVIPLFLLFAFLTMIGFFFVAIAIKISLTKFMANTVSNSLTITCPNCSKQNKSDAGFCSECGVELIKKCKYCSVCISKEDKYCPSCGSQII